MQDSDPKQVQRNSIREEYDCRGIQEASNGHIEDKEKMISE